MDLQAHDLLQQADDLLRLMADGKLPKRADTAAASILANNASLDEGGFQLQCDVNGCSIVPVAKSDAAPSLTGEPYLAHVQRPRWSHGAERGTTSVCCYRELCWHQGAAGWREHPQRFHPGRREGVEAGLRPRSLQPGCLLRSCGIGHVLHCHDCSGVRRLCEGKALLCLQPQA